MMHLTKVLIVLFVLGIISFAIYLIFSGNKNTSPASKLTQITSNKNALSSSKPSASTIPKSNVAPIQTKTFTVSLKAKNSSESGTAKISEFDSQAIFKIDLINQPKNTIQPVFIQSGNCIKLGDIKYTLISAENNKSSTALSYSLGHLILDFPLSIAIYKSVSDPTTLVSCGEIILNSAK